MKLAVFHMLPSGGGCRVVSQFLRGLAGRFDVTLHTPEGAFGLELPEAVSRVSYPFPGSRRLSGLRRMIAPLSLPVRLRAFRTVCRRIADAINHSADAALVHNTLVIAAPPLLEYLEVPSVYYCFEYPRHIYEPDLIMRTGSRAVEMLLAPLEAMERKMDRASADSATRVLSLSSYMRGRIREIYGIQADVIRPGVDTDYYTPDQTRDVLGRQDHFVLSVGALWPFKGHELALESVAGVEEGPRPRLVAVADREYPGYVKKLQNQAVRLGVSLDIRRRITDSELRDLYRNAAAVLCCQHREPYGMVPLEAMACGCPVIAVEEGGFIDNISDGKTGILVKRDAASVSSALGHLLCDSDLWGRLSAGGRKFVQRERTTSRAVDQLGTLLESLV